MAATDLHLDSDGGFVGRSRGRALLCIVIVGGGLLMRPTQAVAEACTTLAERAVKAGGFAHAAQPAWQRRARAAALLPTVRARALYQSGGGQYWPSAEAASDWSYRSGRQVQVSVDLQWDLGLLAWRHDEVLVGRDVLRVAEKRSELVAEVLQLCLEVARLDRQLATSDAAARPGLAEQRARLVAQLVARGALGPEAVPERVSERIGAW